MNPTLIDVRPTDEFTLLLKFDNEDVRLFDMKPFLDVELYKDLKDIRFFKNVKISFDTISWGNEIDIDPEILFSESLKIM